MRGRIVVAALAIAAVLAACRLPFDLPGAPGAKKNAVDLQYIFEAPSEPVNLSVTLDANQRAEALIPVAGGSLSVTGADGTTYTLDIPGDALITDTTISMQPVTSLTGLPIGGEQTYAVQLMPEGLAFNNFVTLTITPPQELPVDQQIMFGYKADGKDMTLAYPSVDAREIKIKLLHFSGYGVTKGLLADTEPVRRRLGGDAEARLQSAVAAELAAERQRQLLGGEQGGSPIDFSDYFKQYEEQVIKPRVAAAGESCAAGRLAVQTVLGLERQKQLLGVSDGTGMEAVAGLIETVGTVCVKEEYQLCAEQHIIHRMIPVWLGMSRQAQLLGVGENGTESGAVRLARELTQKCLSFELVFESTGNFDDGGSGGYESIVKSNVKLRFNPGEVKISGQAPLINTSFNFHVPTCSVSNNRGGGTFDAMSLVYVSDTHSPTDELGFVRDFKLIYYPGNTSESFTITCDKVTYTTPPSVYWTGIYLVSHAEELDLSGSPGAEIPDFSAMFGGGSEGMMGMGTPALPSGAGFVSEDWEVFGNEYFAKKEWTKEDAGLGLVEVGTFKLYHRPGQ